MHTFQKIAFVFSLLFSINQNSIQASLRENTLGPTVSRNLHMPPSQQFPELAEEYEPLDKTVIHYLKNDIDQYPHLKTNFTLAHFAKEGKITTQDYNPNIDGKPCRWPDSAHGRITSEFKEMGTVLGSGTLIGPYHVLTVAQNIYYHPEDFDKLNHPWAKKITFEVGSGESAGGIVAFTCKNWTKDRYYGFGLIILDRPLGHNVGWLGLYSQPELTFSPLKVYTIDYSLEDACFLTKTGKINEEISNQESLAHTFAISKDYSGTALCSDFEQKSYIVGIAYFHDLPGILSYRNKNGEKKIIPNGSKSHRISRQKIDRILEWVNEYEISDFQRKELIKFENLKRQISKPVTPEMQYEIAQYYKNGWGVKKDFEKVFRIYQHILDFSHNIGKNDLFAEIRTAMADDYREGKITNKDLEFALLNYRKAQALGRKNLTTKIGLVTYELAHEKLDESNESISKERENLKKKSNKLFKKAFNLFQQAAEQNDIEAYNKLGFMYREGEGIEKNPSQAASWFQKAAEQNKLDK